MTELSLAPAERARKAHSRVLQSLQPAGTQVAVAAVLGVSESTVSRIKNDRLEEVLFFLYASGWKLVEADKVCVQREELAMLRGFYARAVKESAQLFEDDE
jgi:hypothetical protein